MEKEERPEVRDEISKRFIECYAFLCAPPETQNTNRNLARIVARCMGNVPIEARC